ncbi:MAG TPA: glycosyltransferase family 2 protein [Candidatus Micrarchaeia archaeon]|nr:glycosyltransferase family 2 protein [Candidatus Micrarchaeia archaeon]
MSLSSPIGGLIAGADLLLLMVVICRPLFMEHGDDEGDGLAQVAIPAPRPVHPARTAAFFAILVLISLAAIVWRVPLESVYRAAVNGAAQLLLQRPTIVQAYVERLHPIARLLVASYFVALAFSLRAGMLRRLVVLWHAALYLLLTVAIDTVVLYLGSLSGLPIRSYALESTFIVIASGVLIMARLIFTTFHLPRATTLAKTRPAAWRESVTLVLIIAAVMAAAGIGFALTAQSVATVTLAPVLLALTAGSVAMLVVYGLLLLVGSSPPPPLATGERPPLDVIVPAYNEAARIAPVLDSLERAAARYGGPVRIVVSDDGSEDATVAVARDAMARFRAAEGSVLQNPHRGKAATLNAALRHAKADIVIRFDADNLLHEQAFAQLPQWFADPTIGTVGGTSVPYPRDGSFFHRMRLFEVALGFRFARLGLMAVDGITCIPGSFAAFRRGPVVAFGGVAAGINGEDADVTMQLGRLGYRAVIDRGIIVYDNVPFTLSEFRRQRIRWSRGSVHVFARHSPLRAGLAGPRTWFTMVRMVAINFTSVVRPILLIHGALLAMFEPTLLRNIWFVGVFFILSASPMLLVAVAVLIRERCWTGLGWVIFWFPFAFLRRVFVLESLLSLPTRPVTAPWLIREGDPRWRHSQPLLAPPP